MHLTRHGRNKFRDRGPLHQIDVVARARSVAKELFSVTISFMEWPCTTTRPHHRLEEAPMNGIIYIVGLIVVIMFILSFLGLR